MRYKSPYHLCYQGVVRGGGKNYYGGVADVDQIELKDEVAVHTATTMDPASEDNLCRHRQEEGLYMIRPRENVNYTEIKIAVGGGGCQGGGVWDGYNQMIPNENDIIVILRRRSLSPSLSSTTFYIQVRIKIGNRSKKNCQQLSFLK